MSLKFSIIIPSLNQGKYLQYCLDSIRNQRYNNLEVILIDCLSTDNTLSVVKKNSDIINIFISELDSGQSSALNKGLSLVRGDIIGWMNADDAYLPNAFSKVEEIFTNYPEVDIVFGDRCDIDSVNNIIGITKYSRFSSLVLRYDDLCIGTQSIFWKVSAATKIGMFNEDLYYAMDYDYFLRASKFGLKFYKVNEIMGAMRRHSTSKTFTGIGSKKHSDEIVKVQQLNFPASKCKEFFLKPVALIIRLLLYLIDFQFKYIFNGIKRRFLKNILRL